MSVEAAPITGLRQAASAMSRSGRIRDYGIVVALVAIVIALSLSTNTFLTTSNLINLLDQCADVGLLATGATICILSGVFDLTASASLALAAIVGVDVGAKTQIHHLITKLAADGMAVICVSSEIEELLALSHRVIVLRHGRAVGDFARGTPSEVVIAAAFGDEGATA